MKPLPTIFSMFVPLFVVIFIILTAVFLWMNPIIWDSLYNSPGFPPDTFGFTAKDRAKYSRISLDYMLNGAGISFLGDLKFPDGSPLFNSRELSHMADVKRLAQASFVTWGVLVVLIALSGVLAYRQKWMAVWGRSVSLGGWITILLIVTTFVFIFTSFDTLFTDFHHLFFTGDTWLFLYSDTLIRLFPIAFWQDAFITVGIVAAALAVAAGILGRKL
ncbi:MAG: TIGR01906 family membrane protein [Anaerolineaceae bacterium]|jgi:integral membrane protein (TIGR01906 family)